MSEVTPEIVAEHGLSPEEYDRVLHAMAREPKEWSMRTLEALSPESRDTPAVSSAWPPPRSAPLGSG